MAKKHRAYENDFPSVTQVLDVLRKIGLEFWFKANTPEFIKRESEKGKLIGTQLHEAIQAHIELNEIKVDTQYPEEITNALKGFMQFKKEHTQIKLKRAEIKMTSVKHSCNGTLDCVGNDGEEAIFDWKTGTAKDDIMPKIYDEYVYQVAAYVAFYNELHNANISKAYILSLAKDKVAYNLKEIGREELSGAFNEVFLPALRIWNYKNKKGE